MTLLPLLRFAVGLCAAGPLIAQAETNATAVLARTLAYHDPAGAWPMLHAHFRFAETRADGRESESRIELDNSRGAMRIDFGGKESYEVVGDEVTVLSGERDAKRGLMMRNYFLYLWGLPMKLQDADTMISLQLEPEEVDGVLCDVLRVAYEKDTWYFHIARNNGRMLRYAFYWNDDPSKGEIITLEGEVTLGALRIPQTRSWYKQPGHEFLGTDKLVELMAAE